MKINRRWIYVILMLAIFLGVLGSSLDASLSFERKKMVSSVEVSKIFSVTKTVCIGRFLIDVPYSAEIAYGPAYVGWSVERLKGEAINIGKWVAKSLEKVEEERYIADKRDFGAESMYGKVLTGRIESQKMVFGRASDIAYKIESFIPVGNDLYVQDATPMLAPEEYNSVVMQLNKFASRIYPIADNAIPNEAGMCIDGAFIAETPEYEYERFALGVRFIEYPDVHFSISMAKKDILVESDALEPNLKSTEEDAKKRPSSWDWYSRIKTLRRGERQLGNWKGYEVLARKPAQKGAEESHEFAFVSQGEPKNPLLPVLDLQMDTGVVGNHTAGKPPSVSDEQAIEIWDRLTKSIRPRPVGVAKSSTNSPVEIAVGTVKLAGQSCPQSGWWRCTDDESQVDISGGRVQYLRAGEIIPQAVLLPPATLWQKVRREQPTFQSATPSSWKLMDKRQSPRKQPSTALASASEAVGAHLSHPSPDTSVTAIGEQVTTGQICPASGWWMCGNTEALDDVRWFARGVILPSATIPLSASLVDRLKGQPEFSRLPTTWKLMRHADMSPGVEIASVSMTNAASDHERPT